MAYNTTWEDLQTRAQLEGWDWIDDNTHEWEWLWFGTRQDYVTNWHTNDTLLHSQIGLQYEFAGLLLYNDTNTDTLMQSTETTHFFMPQSIENVTFTSPGAAHGNLDPTGTVQLDLNQTVHFGVTFTQVNGTLFPYDTNNPKDMWGWWDGNIYGADFDVPNFNTKPTTSAMDMMQFMVHFNASIFDDSDAANNEAEMKIDERFGQWSIDPLVVDGRRKTLSDNTTTYLRGSETLTGRSLAASWYITAFTNVGWDVKDERGETLSSDNVTASDLYDITTAAAKFATIRMGAPYDWQKPVTTNDTIRTYNVTSYTTPLGTFRASYESDAGKSSTGFDITESMHFLTVGFNNWDGYSVYHDPTTSVYVAKYGTLAPSEPGPASPLDNPFLVIALVSTIIAIAGTIFILKKPMAFRNLLHISR
jgi:hypothetical protein